MDPSRAEPPALPRLRRPAAVLLGLEGLALLGLATFAFAVIAQVEGGGRFGTGLGVFLVVFALALLAAARSVLQRGRFGVGYGITWQLFQALVGGSLITAGMLLEGAVAILAAIAAFVLLTQIVRATPLPGEGADARGARPRR
ncbi:hypothetical protein [Brachybacterium hainanense]|uniref:Histidine kinase n=1 Tax=Brachybacterium hainanense TaxID=1541174 RepID=A0ABV6RBY9_9MICO